jgi:hypothetical protein
MGGVMGKYLQPIRQWIEMALVIGIAIFLIVHFVLKPSSIVTLPGGQVISTDTKSFNAAVKKILNNVEEQGKKVNELESTVRQQQTHTIEQDIPEALKEKDIVRSVARMKEAW